MDADVMCQITDQIECPDGHRVTMWHDNWRHVDGADIYPWRVVCTEHSRPEPISRDSSVNDAGDAMRGHAAMHGQGGC